MRHNYQRQLVLLRQMSLRLKFLLSKKAGDYQIEVKSLMHKIKGLLRKLVHIAPQMELKKALGGLVAIFGLTFSHQAQGQSFAPPVTNPFGTTPVNFVASPAFVDIDGDGDMDLFVSEYYGDIKFFLNTGTATNPQFASAQTNPFNISSPAGTDFTFITFADLDGDGDFDLLMGEMVGSGYYYASLYYYQNVGNATVPQFAAPVVNPFGLMPSLYFAVPTFADLDNDGDLDLLVGQVYGGHLYYQNTGTAANPQFAAPVPNPFGIGNPYYFGFPHFVDLDGDGDFDLLSIEYYGEINYYENTGTANSPQFAAAQLNPFGLQAAYFFGMATSADLDGDGDVDLLIGEYNGNLQYYRNTTIDVSVAENEILKFNLYPNPTTDKVFIESREEGIKTIEIQDMQGRLVTKYPYDGNAIYLGDLPSGVYMLKLTSVSGNIGVQRVVRK